ncbi:autotransporter [Baekduia sp.]|uniref:autotransporter n=1 Tax=Baekduia sp. TaxID=2600305 RepID=UPI002D770FC1|nr:autotransporter [Baekduia sp.]
MRRIVAALAAAAAALAAGATVAARAAAPAREHVSLSLVRKSGTDFRHQGTATGVVPGRVTSRIRLRALSLSGTVTIRAKRGTVQLRIDGTTRSGGVRSRFEGSAILTAGTGRYAKAKGRGTFTGVVNRRTWAATIDAQGSLTY